MSAITSVMVSVGYHYDAALIEENRMALNGWLSDRSHFPFEMIEDGGGEKTLCCTLFIGSFKSFETSEFAFFLYTLEWPNIDDVQLFIMEIDREDARIWREIKHNA